MKRILSLLLAMTVLFCCAYAANGNVIYDGDAKNFIFEPGSEYSPTDLFSEFKDVMPGDELTQKITLRNDASEEVHVKIYMRSRGAHPNSGEFLSQLKLKIKKSDDSSGYLFDNAANEAIPLQDWILLGTLYSGGEVNLDVILSVPVELDNKYSDAIGYLDWHFMVEEFPIEEIEPDMPADGEILLPDDEYPSKDSGWEYPSKDAGWEYPSKDAGWPSPLTGDSAQLVLWVVVMLVAAGLIFLLLFRKKKDKKDEERK